MIFWASWMTVLVSGSLVGWSESMLPGTVGRTVWYAVFFFFQAEDGIRDYKVTGVQTCALPIYDEDVGILAQRAARRRKHVVVVAAHFALADERLAALVDDVDLALDRDDVIAARPDRKSVV